MIKDDEDRRTAKTKRSIRDALVSLMVEKQYDKITIQDIIDRANVGRSTFYSHYINKEAVTIESIEDMMDELHNHITRHGESGENLKRMMPIMELFEHFQENSRLMRAMFRSSYIETFNERVEEFWKHRLEKQISSSVRYEEDLKIPLPLLSSYLSNTFMFLLKWWFDNKMIYSPKEMEEYFQMLVNPTIEAVGLL